jgi:CHAT domain-containing protein
MSLRKERRPSEFMLLRFLPHLLILFLLFVQCEITATAKDEKEEAQYKLALESLAQAASLKSGWKKQSIQEAVAKYNVAYSLLLSIDSPREAAETIEAAGDLHFVLSEYHEALDAYQKAIPLWRALKGQLGLGGALTKIGYTYIYLGENQLALSYLKRARAFLNNHVAAKGDREHTIKEAQLLNSIGEVYYSLSDVKIALESFNRALELSTSVEDRNGEALAHLNLGYMNFNFGDLNGARSHYEKALSRWIALGHKRGEALARTAIGGIHSFLGEQQTALDLHNKALDLFRYVGDRQGEAATLNGIGSVYEGLNKPQEAFDNYEEAMSIYHDIGNRDYEALGKLYMGIVNRSIGRTEQTLKYLYEALSLLQQVGDKRLETHALKELAATYDLSGQTERALNQYRHVLTLYGRFEDKRGRADTLSSIGDIYFAAAQTKNAHRFYDRALELHQLAQDRSAEISALYKLAIVEREMGDIDRALSRIELSVKLIERLRMNAGTPNFRAAYLASLRKHYELYVDLLVDMDKRHAGGGFLTTAFFISESSRARSLLETLAEAKIDLRYGANPKLIERADSLEQLLDSTTEYQMRLLSSEHNKEDIEANDKKIRNLTAEYEETQSQIREQSSLYAALTKPKLLHVAELQAELNNSNTLLLEYALGEPRSYLFAISSVSFKTYELPARSILEKSAGEVYNLLTARQRVKGESQSRYEERVATADSQYTNAVSSLSQMLLEPVASQLGNQRLIIVSDGTLHYIPFEVLTPPPANLVGNNSREANIPLVAQHEIVYLQSASMLRALRDAKDHALSNSSGIAILADPVFDRDDPRVPAKAKPEPSHNGELPKRSTDLNDGQIEIQLPRLLSTRDEAKMIVRAAPDGSSKVVTSFRATKATVVADDFSRHKILHFATHGVVNDRQPEQSGIMLSLVDEEGNAQNGFLRLSDVYKLKLNSDLIVLSACRSALGKQISGEGFVGLTRGFISSGAQNVIASLWKVDDEATAEFMNQFYQAMLRRQLTPTAALQKAKQSMQAHPKWNHPYYWAAFVAQGEYQNKITIESRFRPPLIAIVTFLSILGLYVRRRMRQRSA